MTAGPRQHDASDAPRIGVLAMQGAFAEHVRALERAGAVAFEVRTPAELDRCEAIVIPGGESTAIRKALERCELYEPLRARIEAGMPALGTCAGMIVLADAPPDGAPPCFGLLDVEVERNGWGRQVRSAEVEIAFAGGGATSAPFIRAPRIVRCGEAVEVVATIADGPARGEAVAVRQGHLLAAAFHPELGDDLTLHRLLVRLARAGARTPAPTR